MLHVSVWECNTHTSSCAFFPRHRGRDTDSALPLPTHTERLLLFLPSVLYGSKIRISLSDSKWLLFLVSFPLDSSLSTNSSKCNLESLNSRKPSTWYHAKESLKSSCVQTMIQMVLVRKILSSYCKIITRNAVRVVIMRMSSTLNINVPEAPHEQKAQLTLIRFCACCWLQGLRPASKACADTFTEFLS